MEYVNIKLPMPIQGIDWHKEFVKIVAKYHGEIPILLEGHPIGILKEFSFLCTYKDKPKNSVIESVQCQLILDSPRKNSACRYIAKALYESKSLNVSDMYVLGYKIKTSSDDPKDIDKVTSAEFIEFFLEPKPVVPNPIS
jgi:hypothetical protein